MLRKSKIAVLGAFVTLAGCETIQQPFARTTEPCQHTAAIGSYPPHLPIIPAGRRVVLVGGVFDLLHHGHASFLTEAKKEGDYLIVAVEHDEFVKRHKHRIPVHNQQQRAELLSHFDTVDAVIMLPPMKGYQDYLVLVQTFKPQVIAVSEGDPRLIEKQKQATTVGAKVVTVTPRNSQVSTRRIIKHLDKGEL